MNDIYNQLPAALLPWFLKNARQLPWRQDKDPYHVWVSEIMLQQTRVEAVKAYYTRFMKELPTIEALAEVSEEKLLKLWEGLGYYNRARNLQKCAKQIAEQYQGVFPNTYGEILALPGIGEYTAGAICSICFEQPQPAVDGNVLRVISRMTENFTPIDQPKYKKEIADALKNVYPKGQCGAFTQSLMELGATVCVPNGTPKCEECPANAFCLAKKHGTADQLPVKTPKKPRRIEEKTVFVFNDREKIAICQRREKGLLAGLWQFPNVEGTLDLQQAIKQAEQWGVVPDGVEQIVTKSHVFTHVEWKMTCYYFTCKEQKETLVWATQEELIGKYALPTAFRIFLNCDILVGKSWVQGENDNE